MLAALPLLLVPALPVATQRPEDEVRLVTGRALSGHVVFEDEQRLILLQGTREREVRKDRIEGFDSVLHALGTALDRLSALDEGEVTGLLDLARYCRSSGLPGEAEVLAWSVLVRAPDNAEAHELLGHRRRGDSWGVRSSGQNHRFEDLARLRDDWGEAWELSTTHYEVRTNLPLEDAARLALDLERIYRGLYAFLGSELELRDVTRPMRAWVHADQSSFPESVGDRRSYFDPQQEALIVNAAGGYDPSTLVHEAVHQFLWATGAGRKGARTQIPGWLDEGLAEYFTGGIAGGKGRISVGPGGILMHHFRQHATAEDPYDLSRVLAFGSDDFGGSSGLALKYAQSYTLVHFCLHGQNGAHRQGFFDFLRACWEGKSSMTDFKRAIGVRERDLEDAWSEYVRDH